MSVLERLRSAMKVSPILSIAAAVGAALVVALLGRSILPPSESPLANPTSVAADPTPTPTKAALIAGSPVPSASIAPSAEPSLAPGVVPVATSPPGGGADALASGTLWGGTHPRGACFWLGEGSSRVALVWPYGFTARTDPLRLVGGDGQVLARRGNEVELGGGGPPVGYIPTLEQDPCKTGDLFAVSSVASVNGVRRDVYGGSIRLVNRPPGTSDVCSDASPVRLMLTMKDGRLELLMLDTEMTVPATWPDGFAARWGNRITVLDSDGDVVMTQGVEDPAVRARITSEGADICGFGDVIYP